MKALILAAGVGRRLGEAAGGRPKALLTFGGKTLLRRHVELLAAAGVDEVVIGVGHRAAAIEAELARIGSERPIRSVHNPRYREGSVVTLWTLRHELAFGGDVLLMDADVLYDRRILSRLRTLHPTLAWNAEGEKFLWIEGHHPFGSTQAMDCDCYPTGFLAKSPKLFLDYANTLDKAWAITKCARAQEQQGGGCQDFDKNNQGAPA